MKKIHFEDRGQDFLWWTIDEENNVVDCGPFQSSVWVGCWVVDSSIMIGEKPRFLTQSDEPMTLNYAIEKIEQLKEAA
jgi:hypothetical protein